MTPVLTSESLRRMLTQLREGGQVPPYVPAHHAEDATGSTGWLDPAELMGRSVLDIGCNIGLRCFESIEAGASRVVGIDVNPDRVLQAGALARVLGYDVEFRLANADHDLPAGPFDTVLCFNILHRSRDPGSLLRRLGERTRNVLVVESPDIDHPSTRHYLGGTLNWWQRRTLRNMPVLAVGRDGPDYTIPEFRYFVSRAALKRLLGHHQGVFGDLRFATGGRAGYYRAIAKRRRIGHLLLIAGASGTGKTTLIQRIQQGTVPGEIAAALELDGFRNAPVMNAFEHTRPGQADSEKLIFHYDLNRTCRQPARHFDVDTPLQVVDCAERVTVVTLWADPTVVEQRQRMRTLTLGRHNREYRERQRMDLEAGHDPARVRQHYRKWFEHSRIWNAAHCVLDSSGADYRLLEAEAVCGNSFGG